MNFVDVQPKSFLDYAWTSPTPPAMSTPKSSKTNRKQNRCCDQCRKGKRACDAAILEDSLLDASKSGDHPSVFHYSGELHLLHERHGTRLTIQMYMDLWLLVGTVKRPRKIVPLNGFDHKGCRRRHSLPRTRLRRRNVAEPTVTPQSVLEMPVIYQDTLKLAKVNVDRTPGELAAH